MFATTTAPTEKIKTALNTRLAELNASAIVATFDVKQYARTQAIVGHVLAIRNAGTDNAEYVVWAWGIHDDDGTAGLYWGHYFGVNEYDDAVKTMAEHGIVEDVLE